MLIEFLNPSPDDISDLNVDNNSDREIQSYCDEINQIIQILDIVCRETYWQHTNLRVFFFYMVHFQIMWKHYRSNKPWHKLRETLMAYDELTGTTLSEN